MRYRSALLVVAAVAGLIPESTALAGRDPDIPSTSVFTITPPTLGRLNAQFTGTGFEPSDGYVPGNISGQEDWSTASGLQSIVAGGFGGSLQSLSLSQGSTADQRPLGLALSPLTNTPLLNELTVETRIDDNGGASYFVGAQSISANTQLFRVQFDYTGDILVLDPSNPASVNGLVDTGVAWKQDQWALLDVVLGTASTTYTYNGRQIYQGSRIGPGSDIEQVVFGHDNLQDFGSGAFSGPNNPPAAYFDNLALLPAPGPLCLFVGAVAFAMSARRRPVINIVRAG